MMMWQGIDQRKFPRVSYKCLIRVSREGREEEIDTHTENVGAGGLCVVLDEDFGLFEEVSLEVFIGENEPPILCTGTIVWVVKNHPATPGEEFHFDTGIEFKDITEEDRSRIARLVENILGSKT